MKIQVNTGPYTGKTPSEWAYARKLGHFMSFHESNLSKILLNEKRKEKYFLHIHYLSVNRTLIRPKIDQSYNNLSDNLSLKHMKNYMTCTKIYCNTTNIIASWHLIVQS